MSDFVLRQYIITEAKEHFRVTATITTHVSFCRLLIVWKLPLCKSKRH